MLEFDVSHTNFPKLRTHISHALADPVSLPQVRGCFQLVGFADLLRLFCDFVWLYYIVAILSDEHLSTVHGSCDYLFLTSCVQLTQPLGHRLTSPFDPDTSTQASLVAKAIMSGSSPGSSGVAVSHLTELSSRWPCDSCLCA